MNPLLQQGPTTVNWEYICEQQHIFVSSHEGSNIIKSMASNSRGQDANRLPHSVLTFGNVALIKMQSSNFHQCIFVSEYTPDQ